MSWISKGYLDKATSSNYPLGLNDNLSRSALNGYLFKISSRQLTQFFWIR